MNPRRSESVAPSKRLVKLCIACSLDGYIAGPNGEIDWLFDPGEFNMGTFFRSIDTVVMGRKTYDFAVSQGHGMMTGTKSYVFTRSPNPPDDPSVEFVSENVRSFVESLSRKPGKDIWLMGGGDLLKSFLAERLVDEMIIGVHPIVLGDGIPLFPGRHERVGYELVGSEAYDSGLVMLSYRLAATG